MLASDFASQACTCHDYSSPSQARGDDRSASAVRGAEDVVRATGRPALAPEQQSRLRFQRHVGGLRERARRVASRTFSRTPSIGTGRRARRLHGSWYLHLHLRDYHSTHNPILPLFFVLTVTSMTFSHFLLTNLNLKLFHSLLVLKMHFMRTTILRILRKQLMHQ